MITGQWNKKEYMSIFFWPKNNQWDLILIVGVFGFYHQSKSNPVLQIDDANNHIYPFKTDEDESSLSSNYAFQTSSKGEKGDRVSENYFHTLHYTLPSSTLLQAKKMLRIFRLCN